MTSSDARPTSSEASTPASAAKAWFTYRSRWSWITKSGAGLASARFAAAAGTTGRSPAGRWVLSFISDPRCVRPLPRHPGLELLFAFELGRNRVRFPPRRILSDAHAIRGRTRRAGRGDERRVALAGQPPADGIGLRTLAHRSHLHDEPGTGRRRADRILRSEE